MASGGHYKGIAGKPRSLKNKIAALTKEMQECSLSLERDRFDAIFKERAKLIQQQNETNSNSI